VRGQPGGITRLLACSEEKLKTYQGLDIGPTFVHRNHREMGGMNYAAFNKPASVNYWVHSGAVPEGVEYVMQLDADVRRAVQQVQHGLCGLASDQLSHTSQPILPSYCTT
jgi:hypothetical protein